MADSSTLRQSSEQHKPKNIHSKIDDKLIYEAMNDCVDYLNKRLNKQIKEYGSLEFKKSITYKEMMSTIKSKKVRNQFDTVFQERTIKPDGGLIVLKDHKGENVKIILVSEVKKQGTNEERALEGKSKQGQGNAIERLGKNLIGIRAMMKHSAITPFVCFGWGCDFTDEHKDDFVMAKLSMMNEFYALNKIHVFKLDGNSEVNKFEPVSMFFRKEQWTKKEMFEQLKEIGETALRYYLF